MKAAKRVGSFCVVYDDDNTEDQIQQCNLRLFWECEVCHDGGELLLCENCRHGFHAKCLGIDSVKDLPDL